MAGQEALPTENGEHRIGLYRATAPILDPTSRSGRGIVIRVRRILAVQAFHQGIDRPEFLQQRFQAIQTKGICTIGEGSLRGLVNLHK